MSIYLEFPSIDAYPIYMDTIATEQASMFTEEDILLQIRQEQQILQDFLRLMTV